MKKFWLMKIIGCMVIGILAVVAIGFAVMTLWNHILVTVLGVKLITYWQAIGIFALCKLLFGGIGTGYRPYKGNSCRFGMKEKWQSMSQEERDAFRENWKNKCSLWGKGNRSE